MKAEKIRNIAREAIRAGTPSEAFDNILDATRQSFYENNELGIKKIRFRDRKKFLNMIYNIFQEELMKHHEEEKQQLDAKCQKVIIFIIGIPCLILLVFMLVRSYS